MSTLSKSEESYIQHEVQLRLHSETFKQNEKRMDRMDQKLNLLITMVVGSIILPVAMRYLHWL